MSEFVEPEDRRRILLHREPWFGSIGVLLCEKDFAGKITAVAKPILLEKRERHAMIDSTFRIGEEAAQSLMDELWNCGIRPTEGAGSAGSLKATERHLEDMRRLVFDNNPKMAPIK